MEEKKEVGKKEKVGDRKRERDRKRCRETERQGKREGRREGEIERERDKETRQYLSLSITYHFPGLLRFTMEQQQQERQGKKTA